MRPVAVGRAWWAVAAVPVAAASIVLGGGAAHAGAPDVSMTSPTGGAVLTSATPDIAGSVSATSPDGTVTGDLQLAVTSGDGHPGWSATRSDWCGQASCRFSVPVSPALAWNGAYTLSVQATESDGGGQSQPVSYEASFSVAAPPTAPSGLTASQSADGRSVTLSWSEDPYPDLVGYQVTRSPSGAGFPAQVTTTGFVDHSTSSGGSYSYEVSAVRRGATRATTVSSAPAGTSVGAPPPAGPSGGGAAPSGPAGGGVGTYSAAAGGNTGGTAAGGGLGSLLAPSGGAGVGLPALPAPTAPGVPVESGAPGSDSPALAPFSSSSPLASAPGQRPVTITYATVRTTDHAALVRDLAAVGLAALLLAVAAHLLWLRRLVRLTPSSPP